MEVILLERVANLGQMGDTVKVKDGYARNFLLPRKKALRANQDNLERFKREKAQLEAQNLTRRKDAEAVAAKIKGLSVTLVRQAGDTGILYGSVSARDIADAATQAGFTINRSQVVLHQPIKASGVYSVVVALHPEVSVDIQINVARSEAEAAAQVAGDAAAEDEQFFDDGAAPADEEAAEEANA